MLLREESIEKEVRLEKAPADGVFPEGILCYYKFADLCIL